MQKVSESSLASSTHRAWLLGLGSLLVATVALLVLGGGLSHAEGGSSSTIDVGQAASNSTAIIPSGSSTPVPLSAGTTLKLIVPSTFEQTGSGIVNVKYYLNNKLVATDTTAPYSYYLNTLNYLNGSYTLAATATYTAAASTTSTLYLTIANPASATQTRLKAEHTAVPVIVVVVVVLVLLFFLRRWLMSRRQVSAPAQPVSSPIVPTPPSADFGPTPLGPLEVTPPASPVLIQPTPAPTPPPIESTPPPVEPIAPAPSVPPEPDDAGLGNG